VTIATTSSQTIDGNTTVLLSFQYAYVTVVSDNANWQIIANSVIDDVRRTVFMSTASGTYATMPRYAAAASGTPTSGALSLTPVWLPSGFVVGNLVWGTAGTAGVTMTHQWAGLYDSSYAQLAVTSDKTSTAIAADTKFTWAIATIASGASTTFTTTYAGTHFLGLMIAATTVPTLCTAFGTINPFMTETPAFGQSDTGQTTPPAFPHTATTPTNISGTAHFVYMAATA